jgi:hypothetical protein
MKRNGRPDGRIRRAPRWSSARGRSSGAAARKAATAREDR